MDISSLNTAKLKELLKLTEARDAITSELQKVEEAIASIFSGQSTPTAKPTPYTGKRRGRKPGSKASKVALVEAAPTTTPAAVERKTVKKASKKGGRRGAMKEQIIAVLKEAGTKGASVKDISSQLGVKSQNVHVWFATTGKTAGVKKLAPGVYRLK
ncbi:hypothetical protein BH09VER1_BH09VER1_26110 [soil metagenome]